MKATRNEETVSTIRIEITVPAEIGEVFAEQAMYAAVANLRSALKASRTDGETIGEGIDYGFDVAS